MRILTINSGSSSIKFSLYEKRPSLTLQASGRLDRIGLSGGVFLASSPEGLELAKVQAAFDRHATALKTLFSWLSERALSIDAVGHRVVHGGDRYTKPQSIDEGLMFALKKLIPFAAEHLPHEIEAIESVSASFPDIPQVACFDTSFHRSMPKAAETFALPGYLKEEGIIRYGFHGLSYEFISEELKALDPLKSSGRTIIAHLGNGASMCALKGGRSVDTTMGFTPLGGLVMSTRSGDLDPGIIIYLLKNKGMGADEINRMLNKKSGLLGVSGISPDMSDLLKRKDEAGAREAIELFCYQARKFTGALSAALGGLDTLVFTAGMGENSPEVRERICAGLEFIGVKIDKEKNYANHPVISEDKAAVTVRVMKTNEELMIARQVEEVLKKKGA